MSEGKGAATSAELGGFFETELTRLYGLCFQMLQDHTEAEDAVQETAMRAIRAIKTFRGEAGLSTWVFRICVNVCRDRIRDRARERQTLEDARLDALWRDEHYAVDPSVVVSQLADRARLRAALERLSPAQRIVLLLHDSVGWPPSRIGDELGLAGGTVKSHLRRARMAMVTLLASSKPEDAG
ncbi:MAG TPA: RNA polymerase sigma factor [Candidatus Sulfotelmatobacter sp.]|nr:RNA polymerase sigma factor [Candidatus Sulfotelmatobacter sp.]